MSRNVLDHNGTNLSDKQLQQNFQKLNQKRVQFFQDFDDSSVSESIIDDTRMTEIVYMDIMELKVIRQKVENQILSEENCAQYLIKMKTFLNLKQSCLSGELLEEFRREKVWARHFVDNYQVYMNKKVTRQQAIKGNNTNINNNPITISLTKDEQSLQIIPPASSLYNFNKNKNRPSINNSNNKNQQTFGVVKRLDQIQINKRKIDFSGINNFTINEVPIDESRYTEKEQGMMNGRVPVFNNSSEKVNGDGYGYGMGHDFKPMQLNPANKRKNIFKPIQRPQPEDTLPLQQSTLLNNISIPIQLSHRNIHNKNNNQFTNKPGIIMKKNIENNNNVEYYSSSGQKDFTASNNNPFANSKTNYNYNNTYQSNDKASSYEVMQQNKLQIDMHSPIRNRMAEDDLDSDNLDDALIIKPNYQKHLIFSSAQNNLGQSNQTATQYAKTQVNFFPPQSNTLNGNSKSHQKLMSQQLSPRSNTYNNERSSKKRLSELTSQKKQRKNNALRQQTINWPQEYAFRPYSVHFRKDEQNFNNFKRNCLQQKFTIYVSEELVIVCKLRKVKQSRVQVEIVYENQCREQLSIGILYKIPKSFKIQKVGKIHRKFILQDVQSHKFNLRVSQFPLEMCFLQLSYGIPQHDRPTIIPTAHIPLPITIKNFIQTLASSRQEWIKTYKKLTIESTEQPFVIEKTFEINNNVVEPSYLQDVLGREFMNIGASEGYSVEELGCICHYREINNLMFLLRIAIRVDHIATLTIITESQLTENQKDFLNYFMEILLTILAKYPI